MKLEYQSTLDDVIETQMLWLRDIKTVAKWRIWGGFYWILIATLIFTFATGPTINRLLIGVFLGGLVGGNLVFNAENALKRKMKKLILKKEGTFEPATAVVTVSGSIIEFSSRGTTVEFNLQDIESLENEKSGLVVNFKKGRILYIPSYAFNGDDEKDMWLKELSPD